MGYSESLSAARKRGKRGFAKRWKRKRRMPFMGWLRPIDFIQDLSLSKIRRSKQTQKGKL